MLGTILIVILLLALIGALPRWSHSREWGYAPTGGLDWCFSSWSFCWFSDAFESMQPAAYPAGQPSEGGVCFPSARWLPYLVVLMCSGGSSAYSVLTHEEIVDLLWTDEIRPTAAQALSRSVRRPAQRGARLCLWRRRHPGSGLLSVRQHKNSAIWCTTSAAETSFANC
jgi:hypothetical protein